MHGLAPCGLLYGMTARRMLLILLIIKKLTVLKVLMVDNIIEIYW